MRTTIRVFGALIASLLAVSCGQNVQPTVREEAVSPPAARVLPGAPAAEQHQTEQTITFTVWSPHTLDEKVFRTAASTDGVVAAGRILLGSVGLEKVVRGSHAHSKTHRTLSVVAISPHPLEYSSSFSRIAAELSYGYAALNAQTASFRDVALGDTLQIAGGKGTLDVKVGAVLQSDSLFSRELVLPVDSVVNLGVSELRAIVVVATLDSFAAVSKLLVDAAGAGARIRPLEGADDTRGTVMSAEDVKRYFGSFPYVRGPGDSIIPDPRWVRASIIDWKVPVIGWVRCHRNIIAQLYYAMLEIQQQGLAPGIKTYDGCYVPRMQRLDDTVLSAHAYGIAIDLNAATNSQGDASPDIDPRIVLVMKRWGFAWGGDFSVPDGMHFEIARIVQTQR